MKVEISGKLGVAGNSCTASAGAAAPQHCDLAIAVGGEGHLMLVAMGPAGETIAAIMLAGPALLDDLAAHVAEARRARETAWCERAAAVQH